MCFYHKATDLVTRLYGAQGAMGSTLATWTNKGDCRVQWSVKSEGIWRFFGSFSGAIALRSAGEMAVDICGHLDVRVAQPLLHVFQAVALRQQHAGAGVAQVVEPDMGQVVLLQQLVEGVAHIIGGVGVPVLPGEHLVVVYVVLAEVVAVVLLLL